MLWQKYQQYKEIASVAFCVLFSLTSLIWNSNMIARTVASSHRVGDTVSSSLDSAGGFFKGIVNRIQSYETVKKERDAYRKQVEDLQMLPQDLDRFKKENGSLRKELGFRQKTSFPLLKAEVLSVRLNSIYRTIIIDKGSDDGIRPYMPVLSTTLNEKNEIIQAIAGKVIAVTGSTSVIQPIVNSNFSMGVQMPGTSLWASLSGNSGRSSEAVLNYIDSGIIIDPGLFNSYPIGPQTASEQTPSSPGFFSKIGKAVYTSGGSGVYPPGIPVGTITEEGSRNGSFKSAYLKPFVKFEEIQFVSVMLKLPEKWAESWPEEKNISIENPYFGEINFPGEEKEKEKKNPPKSNSNKKDKPKEENSPPPKLQNETDPVDGSQQ